MFVSLISTPGFAQEEVMVDLEGIPQSYEILNFLKNLSKRGMSHQERFKHLYSFYTAPKNKDDFRETVVEGDDPYVFESARDFFLKKMKATYLKLAEHDQYELEAKGKFFLSKLRHHQIPPQLTHDTLPLLFTKTGIEIYSFVLMSYFESFSFAEGFDLATLSAIFFETSKLPKNTQLVIDAFLNPEKESELDDPFSNSRTINNCRLYPTQPSNLIAAKATRNLYVLTQNHHPSETQVWTFNHKGERIRSVPIPGKEHHFVASQFGPLYINRDRLGEFSWATQLSFTGKIKKIYLTPSLGLFSKHKKEPECQAPIVDETLRESMALSALLDSAMNSSLDIFEQYQINNSKVRLKLLIERYRKKKFYEIKLIPYLGMSEEQRTQLAIELCTEDSWYVAFHFKTFQIERSENRFQVAQAVGKKDARSLGQHLEDFNISDPDKRLQLAKTALEGLNNYNFSLFIKKFEIENEFDRYHLALLAARDDHFTFAQNFKHYALTNPDYILEVAKVLATNKGSAYAYYSDHFEVREHDKRFELALIAANSKGQNYAKYFSEFMEFLPEERLQLAKANARVDGKGVSTFIKKFDLPIEEDRLAVALLAADQNPNSLGWYIPNYQLENEQNRLKVAKHLARSPNSRISLNIDRFSLQKEKDRFDVALMAASHQRNNVSRFLANYKLSDEKQRLELAKLLVGKENNGFSQYFKNFTLSSEHIRYELALKELQANPKSLARYFSNYQISDSQRRFEIAKSLIAIDPKLYESYRFYFAISHKELQLQLGNLLDLALKQNEPEQ